MGRRSEIDILTSFDTDAPRTAAEIVASTGLPRSTVFRALRMLVQSGLLQQESKFKRYSLGVRVLQLGRIALRQLSPEELFSPSLLGLAATTRETVTFSLVDVPWRLCAYVIDAPSDLRSVAQAGARYALHVGGSSSAILAHLPEEVATGVLRFHGVEESSILERLTALQEVREAGVAVSVGQRVPGAASIAAPVFMGDGVFGSLAVAGPSERLVPQLDEFGPLVAQVARELSEKLTEARASAAV